MYDADVLVVGGGPGGLATASHARRQGLSVILAAWCRITREYRLLTRALVLSTATRTGRRAVVPSAAMLPAVFDRAVNTLAR